jgi:anti-anti-sigma factor
MTAPGTALLEASLDGDVLVFTALRPQFEGEEVATALKEELLGGLARHKASKVVLDLTGVRYLTSVVFWPLLVLRKQLHLQGGRLLLCGLTETVRDIFTTTRMVSGPGTFDAPFEVKEDRAQALAQLGAG